MFALKATQDQGPRAESEVLACVPKQLARESARVLINVVARAKRALIDLYMINHAALSVGCASGVHCYHEVGGN